MKNDHPTQLGGLVSRRSLLHLAFWILVFLLPLVLVAGGLLSAASVKLTRFLHDRAQRAAVETVEALDHFAYERYGDVLTVSGLPLVKTLDQPRLAEILDRLVTTHSFYRLALVADWQGRILAVNRVDGAGHAIPSAQLLGQSVAKEPWFVETLRAPQPIRVEDFHVDPLLQAMAPDGQAVASLSAPIVNDERAVVGVLSVRMTADPLREILTRRAQGNSSTEPSALVLLNQQNQSLLATAGLSQPGVSLRATAASSGFLKSVGLNWRVQVYGPSSQFSLPSPQRLWLGIGLSLLLAGAGIVWAVNRHLLQPMRRLTWQREQRPGPRDATRGKGVETKASPATGAAPTHDKAVRELELLVQSRTQELNKIQEALQREVTERVRAEEALRKAQGELEPRAQKRPLSLAQTSEALQAETAESK